MIPIYIISYDFNVVLKNSFFINFMMIDKMYYTDIQILVYNIS